MADTVTSIPLDERPGKSIMVGIAAATKILLGILTCRNAAGYAVPGSDTANLVFLGVSEDEVDNTSGAAGDLSVPVRRKGTFKFLNDAVNPITIASIGVAGAAFIKDNQTVCVAAGAANDIPVGRPVEIASDGVWVEIG